MQPTLQLEILEQLTAYLADENTLDTFESWFVPASWRLNDDAGPAYDLASAIELALAEHSAGHANEDELRRLLTESVELVKVAPTPAVLFATGASNTHFSHATRPIFAGR